MCDDEKQIGQVGISCLQDKGCAKIILSTREIQGKNTLVGAQKWIKVIFLLCKV